MERTSDADVLNFHLRENVKFNSPTKKYSEKLPHHANSEQVSEFSEASVPNPKRMQYLDHSFPANLVKSNSSPNHSDMNPDDKKPLRVAEQISGHDLMRLAGIGRGKHRVRYSSVNDTVGDNFQSECSAVTSNFEKLSCTEFPELGVKTICNLDIKKPVNIPDRSEPVVQNIGMAISGSNERKKAIENQLRDIEIIHKNVHNTFERFAREHDYRRMQNGIPSGNKNYKGKNFRPNHFHNGASAVPYNYDNRALAHYSLPPNMKSSRAMKPNENYYRHNDPRRNQSTKPPFPTDIDKIIYSKHRSNICIDKDVAAYDSNRNLMHYTLNKPDINSHMQIPEPYVRNVNSAAYRRRSYGNKIDPKQWSSNRSYSDASCHRTMMPLSQSVESVHSESLPSDRVASGSSYVSKTPCDLEVLELQEGSPSCDKESVSLKARCSPLNSSHFNVAHGNNITSHRDNLSSQATNFPPPSKDKQCELDYNIRYCSPIDNSLVEKSGLYTSGLPSCDSHCEKSSHPKSNECSPLSDQSSVSDIDVMQCPVTYGSLNCCSPTAMTVVQASYADIMRAPAVSMNKLSPSQVFHTSSGVAKMETALCQDVDILKEVEPSNSSSEWIISRLSQANLGGDVDQSINGINHPQANATSHEGLRPRPIAVSVEKPSFYNTSLGIGKNLNVLSHQTSLTSPEKRMLECHIVEEHLCNLQANKKSEEKFQSDSPISFPSLGEQSHSAVCTRTDSIFSDSSSVCSSSSSVFKSETQHIGLEAKAAPVIIMKNCMPQSNVSDISFGIEIDEIMQICSETPEDMKATSSSASDSDFSLTQSTSKESVKTCAIENNSLDILVVAGKRFLWKDERLDVSKCNLSNIMGFLHDAWHCVEVSNKIGVNTSSNSVKYYNSE